MARFESLEEEIQMAVSGIATQANFQMQKTRLLPMMSLNQQLADRDVQIAKLKQRIEDLQNSASWKLMSPLRLISEKIKTLTT